MAQKHVVVIGASALVLAAALATSDSTQGTKQSTQTGKPGSGGGTIAVPPGPVPPPIGFPPYSDGTPCIGTPKDPTRFPDKTSNPCDGKPLPPAANPGPPLLPIGYPPYPDGTPCLGEPKDPTRFPIPIRPNEPNPNPCSKNPHGEKPQKAPKKSESAPENLGRFFLENLAIAVPISLVGIALCLRQKRK